jgi:hypothetical protein
VVLRHIHDKDTDMTRVNKEVPPSHPEGETQAATPEREPHESNYGYEADHPSYELRKAGAWTPKHGASKDYRPADPPPLAPPDVARSGPANPGKNPRR